MKNNLVLLFILACSSVYGQTNKPIGQPTDLSTYRGGLSVDSFIHVPNRDTTAWFGRKSDFVRRNDTLFYYDKPSDKYRTVNSTAGFINWADTTNAIATKTDMSADFVQTATGLTGNTITLAKTPKVGERLIVIMNTALIYPVDYTLSGNTLTLSFTPAADDKFLIYIKTKWP